MARPTKNGLEYFSLDVSFYWDIKIRKLVRRKGGQALTVYTVLLCLIYKNGYYLEWDDDLPFIISEATNLEEDTITDAILYCVEVGLFNRELYEKDNVLTSHSIQERYKSACGLTKRKLSPDLPYQLVALSQQPATADKKSVLGEQPLVFSEETPISSEETPVNSEETPITSEETPINSGKSTQNKEKKNIYKDSSLRSESMSDERPTNHSEQIYDIGVFVSFFNETVANTPIPKIKTLNTERKLLLNSRIKEHGKDGVATVIRKAAASSFLTGGQNGWIVTFDWLIRPRNFLKVLEGNYDDRENNTNPKNNTGYGGNNGHLSNEDIDASTLAILNRMDARGRTPESEIPFV